MKLWTSLAFLLALPAPAFAAITNIGNLGTGAGITSGTSIVITTSATLNQHNIALVKVASDNAGSIDGNNNEHKSVTDSAGNIYTKMCEYTYAEAGAGNAATVSVWVGRAATALSSGGTITITLASAVGARVAQAQELGVVDGNTLQAAGTCKTENISGTDAGSLTTDTLPSKEYLFVRAIGLEARLDSISTATTNYTELVEALIDGGTIATSMSAFNEIRILTGTSDSSDPTLSSTARDGVSIYFALEECTPGVNCTGDVVARARPPVIVQ